MPAAPDVLAGDLRARALTAVALAAAAWGTWSLFLRPAGLPSATASVIIFAVMGLSSLPWALRSPPVTWDRRAVALLAANSAFDALNLFTFALAMQHTTVAIAVLTHYLAPVLVAVLAPWIDRRRVAGAIPAALVAVAGLALVLEPWRAGDGHALLGAAFGTTSAFAYAGNVFVVRRLSSAIGPQRAVSYHSFGSALLLLPLAVAAGGELTGGGVALLSLGAITLGMLGGVAFVWGVARIASTTAATLCYLEPLVAVAVGALVWREPMGQYAAVGALCVLASGVHVARSQPPPAAT